MYLRGSNLHADLQGNNNNIHSLNLGNISYEIIQIILSMRAKYLYSYVGGVILILPSIIVFINNHMALMSLRSLSYVNATMVLMRADRLCLHTYKRISIINSILRYIMLEPVYYCLCCCHLGHLTFTCS